MTRDPNMPLGLRNAGACRPKRSKMEVNGPMFFEYIKPHIKAPITPGMA